MIKLRYILGAVAGAAAVGLTGMTPSNNTQAPSQTSHVPSAEVLKDATSCVLTRNERGVPQTASLVFANGPTYTEALVEAHKPKGIYDQVAKGKTIQVFDRIGTQNTSSRFCRAGGFDTRATNENGDFGAYMNGNYESGHVVYNDEKIVLPSTPRTGPLAQN